jgi:hypothetical protein
MRTSAEITEAMELVERRFGDPQLGYALDELGGFVGAHHALAWTLGLDVTPPWEHRVRQRLDERSQTIAATTLTFLIHRVYQTLRELNHRGLDDLATDLHQAVNDYENTFRKATR